MNANFYIPIGLLVILVIILVIIYINEINNDKH